MSDGLVPVDPNSQEARNAVLALLGTTLAELKQIDKNIVGTSKDIVANRTNLENVFNIREQVLPQQPPQPQIAAPIQITVNTPPPPATSPQITDEDPNQLIFDFSKKITPDTINDKLDRILDKLDRVIDLLKKS